MEFIEAKICLLGDSGVGKSSLATRFVHNTFNSQNESTIGASFLTKTFIYNQINYKLNIWDTAGQERYRALAPMYYRQAMVCIVVYDVTQMETFRSVVSWIRELQTHLKEKTVIAIAGNKCDLHDQRQVAQKEGREYAQSINALFVETSAKSALNVCELFCAIANQLPKECVKSESTVSPSSSRRPEAEDKRHSKCC